MNMRHRNAHKFQYKVTLPVILLLSLAAVYFFHTIIIEQKNYTDTNNKLIELKLNAHYIYNEPSGTAYDLHRFKSLAQDLQNYPEENRFHKYISNENTGLFTATEAFLAAVTSKDHTAMKGAIKDLNGAINIILSDTYKIFKSDATFKIKLEYAFLFLICILVIIHFFFVDNPMRQELKKNAREKEVSRSTIRKLAERDTLTNLPGRMKFYEESEREIAAATRYNSDLALIKMDIHDFKGINQKHGQKAGDKILAGFSRTVRKNLRRPDSFFRVGGDKFIILAPHTTLKNAENLTEKINKLLSTSKALKIIPFKINVGIASCSPDETAETLLRKVNDALSEAKTQGAGSIYAHPQSQKSEE